MPPNEPRRKSPASLWVARLEIRPATAHKVSSRHGYQADEIRAAVERAVGLRYGWELHPERGLRAIVETDIRGPVLVVLYPTARPVRRDLQPWQRIPAQPTEVIVMADDTGNDFYEEDEDVEEVEAAFERANKGLTAHPAFFVIDVAQPSQNGLAGLTRTHLAPHRSATYLWWENGHLTPVVPHEDESELARGEGRCAPR